MLDTAAQTIAGAANVIRQHGTDLLKILGCVWAFQLLNSLTGNKFNIFGIHPRNIFGIPGIVLSPFLHAGFGHLFINSVLWLALAGMLMINSTADFYNVTLVMIIISGTLTWIFGRNAIHVGASGLVMAYWGYLLVNAYNNPTLLAIILGGICFYYFAEMASNIVPDKANVSWEGHLLGLIAGIGTSFFYPYILPYLSSAAPAANQILTS